MSRDINLNSLASDIYEANKAKGFWDKERNVGEMLMLVNTELSEALEAHRKDLMDDHLPEYKGFDVEIGDAMIRLFDMAGGLNIDLDTVISKKLEYNANRPRLHGKKY